MTFDEFTRSCGVGCHEPDVEYYMEKAWNAAVDACMIQSCRNIGVALALQTDLEALKTPQEGSNDSAVVHRYP